MKKLTHVRLLTLSLGLALVACKTSTAKVQSGGGGAPGDADPSALVCTAMHSWWVPLVVLHMSPMTTLKYGAVATLATSELAESPVCSSEETNQFTAEQVGAMLGKTIDYEFLNEHTISMQSNALSLNNYVKESGGDTPDNIANKAARVVADMTAFDDGGLNYASAWANAKGFQLMWDQNLVEWAIANGKPYSVVSAAIQKTLRDIEGSGGPFTTATSSVANSALTIDDKVANLRHQADEAARAFYEPGVLTGGSYCRNPKPFDTAESAFISAHSSKVPLIYQARKKAIDEGPICAGQKEQFRSYNTLSKAAIDQATSIANAKTELKIAEFSKAIQDNLIDDSSSPLAVMRRKMSRIAFNMMLLDAEQKKLDPNAEPVDLAEGN